MPFCEPSVLAMMQQISLSLGKGRRSVRDRLWTDLLDNYMFGACIISVHVYPVFWLSCIWLSCILVISCTLVIHTSPNGCTCAIVILCGHVHL